MGKKAYMLTMEAFFAFFITFIFVVFVVLKGGLAKAPVGQLEVLPALEQRDDFRDCVNTLNTSCAEALVRPFVPATYDFRVAIGAPTPFKGAKDIYTETIFISSDRPNDYKVVYLYYWPLSG